MCGIVGALAFKDSHFHVVDSYITRMRETMAHRGPDGAANWISPDGRVGLGHRRLSIIDLSTSADQPMCNEDGNLWIVFNGEIYNHADIRAELERRGGHRWKTDHSDTEVILHAFEEWGIECLQRFRGIFAIAMWDAKAEHLWLIRDRLGVKPLYYSVHHGRLTFASEIKALLKDPDQKREANEEALFHYLTFLTAPAPHTFFDGIFKLPPSTWLRVDMSGHVTETRYWDMLDHTTPLVGASEEEIAERLISELRTSVKLRKVSDVPVGVFLSGGVDSSTNAALFSEGETRPVRTFTIGYAGDNRSYRNETDYARLMADRIGAEHHELLLTVDDLLDFLPRMIYLQDEPLGDPVCVPVYYVSKLARDNGVTVCQVGEGADELFCGYESWRVRLYLQRLNDAFVPDVARGAARICLRMLGRGETMAYEALRRASDGRPIFWGGTDAFTRNQKLRLLSPRLRDRFVGYASWYAVEPMYRRFREKAWEPSTMHWMTYVDLNLRLPELLLMRVDKMSMGVSLEAREPFLDHKFVETAMSIPEAVNTRRGKLKYIFKKAVRGIIPDELIDRRKQGFGVPMTEWFYQKIEETARMVLGRFCRKTDFFDRKEVLQVLDQGKGKLCWYLLNLALWHDYWIEGLSS
jgi:asparagine synthase (glutamine-hydrolysing)